MDMKESSKPWGELSVYEMSSRDSQLILEGGIPWNSFIPSGGLICRDNNVITNNGDKRIAELVGGISTFAVTKMSVGDGGTSLGDPTVPIAPTKGDSSLGHELVKHTPITSATVLSVPSFQLELIETFFTNDPNLIAFLGAKVLNEAGLFSTDDILFARKTFVPIPFDIIDRLGVICRWNLHVL